MNSARFPSTTPNLFSLTSGREPSSSSPPASSSSVISHATETVRSSRHVLPKDLETAIKRLDDQELDRLSEAVFAEQKRRGRKTSDSEARASKRQMQSIAVHLTQGKLNAVRAAFKAGVTPSRIAKQFGISQSDVRKALASDERKR
jgi:predicted DNA binding protein